MSSLSDFSAARLSGGISIKYYTNPGAKTLVEHGGKDKRIYIGDHHGTVSVNGAVVSPGAVFLATSDFIVDVTLDGGYAAIQYLVQED